MNTNVYNKNWNDIIQNQKEIVNGEAIILNTLCMTQWIQNLVHETAITSCNWDYSNDSFVPY